MRPINRIVLHTTASSTEATAASVLRYFREVKKWRNPGYHVIIERDGTPVYTHPFEQVANGARGYNADSIHVAYIGGIDERGKPTDNRTEQQKQTMAELVEDLLGLFPGAEVVGHRDLPGVRKACPCFDVSEWLKEINLKP